MVDLPEPGHASWPDSRPMARPKPVPRNRPLTPAEVEEAIRDMLIVLEDDVEELERRNIAAAIATTEYRVRKAQMTLRSERKTVVLKEAAATEATADELLARELTIALRDSAQEAIRVRRGELEALRTIAASARAVETGRGN